MTYTNKNRFFTGLAIAAISLAAFSACGKNAASTASATTSYGDVQAERDPATNKVYDFGGMAITIYDWWSNPDAKPSTKAQIDTQDYRDWMFATYNFSVKQETTGGWSGHPGIVEEFCTRKPKNEYKVFIIDGRSAAKGVQSGWFYDLSKIHGVDWNNPKWDQAVIQRLKKGKSFYSFNPENAEPREGIFFNKRILQENGFDPDYPYTLQKNRQWTWEKFDELCGQIMKNNATTGVWPFCSSTKEATIAALASNGAEAVGKDSTGRYVNNIGSRNALEALAWLKEMCDKYQNLDLLDSDYEYYWDAFRGGKVAFTCAQEYNASPTSGAYLSTDMEEDWGYVAFPMGPSGDRRYKTVHDSNMYVLPGFYSQEVADKIMKAIDLYTDKTPGYTDADGWKDSYYANFRDTHAIDETMQYMLEAPNPRFDSLVTGLSFATFSDDIIKNNLDPKEAVEKYSAIWQPLINAVN